MDQNEQPVKMVSSTWSRAAVFRVMILWIFLVVWGVWGFILVPSVAEIAVALQISVVVGSILNVLNWIPYPYTEDRVCRLAWAGRLIGNYAIPFAVSLTSGIFAR